MNSLVATAAIAAATAGYPITDRIYMGTVFCADMIYLFNLTEG